MIPVKVNSFGDVNKALLAIDRRMERWLRFEEMNRLTVRFMDDFLGDVIADQWGSHSGTDPQVVAPAILAGTRGGVVRMTTGDDAAADMATNGVQLESALNWNMDQGELVFSARVKMSAITNVAVFVGLTDQVAALEMPIHSAGAADTITTNATDGVGVFFDTAMTTDNWWAAGVANNTDATKQNLGLAPVADTWEDWRIVLRVVNNQAVFYRNGKLIGTPMALCVTSSALLTPVIAAFARGAASRTVDADYVSIQAMR